MIGIFLGMHNAFGNRSLKRRNYLVFWLFTPNWFNYFGVSVPSHIKTPIQNTDIVAFGSVGRIYYEIGVSLAVVAVNLTVICLLTQDGLL